MDDGKTAFSGTDPVYPYCPKVKDVHKLEERSGIALNKNGVEFRFWKVVDENGQAAKVFPVDQQGQIVVDVLDERPMECTWAVYHVNKSRTKWIVVAYPGLYLALLPDYETIQAVFNRLYRGHKAENPLKLDEDKLPSYTWEERVWR